MSHYEIEIKSLLGDKAKAEALKQKMCVLDPNCAQVTSNKQLNHYFAGGNMEELFRIVTPLLSAEQQAHLQTIVDKGSDFSVRTREKDTEVYLVVKASIDAGTSANTISRLEFEERVPLSLSDLDTLLEEAGFDYQAKWSREREEYNYKGATVCIDCNAGYGYLAEFEKLTDDEASVPQLRDEIVALMEELEVEELDQERLARMFQHYNTNWRDYYGTQKTFIIE